MTAQHVRLVTGLLVPASLLLGLAGLVLMQLGIVEFRAPARAVTAPATTIVASRPFTYRASGDYLRNGHPEDAPLVEVAAPQPLEIMTFEVGTADYGRCVADGACRPAETRLQDGADLPVTGISFHDANDYAAWLSRATNSTWRLPTIEEWLFAAGSQAVDPALDSPTDAGNPAERWLAQYEKEMVLGDDAFATPEPLGSFGANEFGISDMTGPVWEWTSTCATRTVLDTEGNVLSHIDSCGVRHLEGRHRAAMNFFVRDARGGGCAVGAPPDNIGFRLIREPAWHEALFRSAFGRR
ncbi:MAG TPA: SUMF1/EgtB/PvdO family nonheme iron enzyme [Devosia sp.]|mgnify:CR=1 FL=1|nr:SUMF1/EgtB/PvdO family nonheme iron enzyme [Devosia sp.]